MKESLELFFATSYKYFIKLIKDIIINERAINLNFVFNRDDPKIIKVFNRHERQGRTCQPQHWPP
jgi:hypothetical protein